LNINRALVNLQNDLKIIICGKDADLFIGLHI